MLLCWICRSVNKTKLSYQSVIKSYQLTKAYRLSQVFLELPESRRSLQSIIKIIRHLHLELCSDRNWHNLEYINI